MLLPQMPLPNTPISATWARDVLAAVRRLQVGVLAPLRIVRSGPDGIVLGVGAVGVAERASAALPAPWDITVVGNLATCTDCYLLLSDVLHNPPDNTPLSVALSGGVDWVCATYDPDSKTLGLAQTMPAINYDPQEPLIKVPLYKVASSDGVWRVVLDARSTPSAGVYL